MSVFYSSDHVRHTERICSFAKATFMARLRVKRAEKRHLYSTFIARLMHRYVDRYSLF